MFGGEWTLINRLVKELVPVQLSVAPPLKKMHNDREAVGQMVGTEFLGFVHLVGQKHVWFV